MSFGLCNWFVKDEYDKCKLASKEIDAATAREMVRMAIDEQIKKGITRANEDIYEGASRGRTCCYTSAFDNTSANEACNAIKENLENRGFEVDVMSGRISWKRDMAVVEAKIENKGENKHDNNFTRKIRLLCKFRLDNGIWRRFRF